MMKKQRQNKFCALNKTFEQDNKKKKKSNSNFDRTIINFRGNFMLSLLVLLEEVDIANAKINTFHMGMIVKN